jgi:signal peptidase II
MNKKIIIIAIIVLLIDQISKILVSSFFGINHIIWVIHKFFYLTYVTNTGAAWSILSNKTYLLVIIGLFALLLIIKYMNSFKINKRNNLAFGLLLGGISGNLLDRMFFGYVRDFIGLKFWSYNYPIFNISDIAIFCGIILLVVAIIKGEDNGSSSRCKPKKNR